MAAIQVLSNRTAWGLLCKPRSKQGKWWWPVSTALLYNTREEALEQCNDWNIRDAGYVYKPVEVSLEAQWSE